MIMAENDDQARAAHALQTIRDLDKLGRDKYGKYVSYVSALPAQIIINGLGQALATLMAAGGRGKKQHDPHYMLYLSIANWLMVRFPEWEIKDGNIVIDRLVQGNQDTYLRAQAESLAYLNWLKKFARGILEEVSEQEGDQ